MLASARRRDRLPYELPPTSDAIVSQLAAGIPVLVLQKLGAGPWPGWHYAVVIGYDVERQVFLLRSGYGAAAGDAGGEVPRDVGPSRPLGDRRAAARPDAGAPDAGRYVEAAAALEAVGHIDAARVAYQAAAIRWPRDALPRLALGNVALARGDLAAAESDYRRAIELDRGNAAAHNNLAEVLLRRGCVSAARSESEIATSACGDRAAGGSGRRHCCERRSGRQFRRAGLPGSLSGGTLGAMTLKERVDAIFPEWQRWYPSLFDAAVDLGRHPRARLRSILAAAVESPCQCSCRGRARASAQVECRRERTGRVGEGPCQPSFVPWRLVAVAGFCCSASLAQPAPPK